MFDIENFIKTNLINGVLNGSFTREYANILAVNYLTKGLLNNDDLMIIDDATIPREDTEEPIVSESESDNNEEVQNETEEA